MILHTINKVSALALCRELIDSDDRVVLLEDGVYLAMQSLPFSVSVLNPDVEARGLSERLGEQVDTIEYSDFVRLCAEADKVCSWF